MDHPYYRPRLAAGRALYVENRAGKLDVSKEQMERIRQRKEELEEQEKREKTEKDQ